MLVEVLNVLPLLLELLLDGEEPAYLSAVLFDCHCILQYVWGGGKSIDDAGSFVLGLLFLADVELFGGSLALGEGITVTLSISMPFKVFN